MKKKSLTLLFAAVTATVLSTAAVFSGTALADGEVTAYLENNILTVECGDLREANQENASAVFSFYDEDGALCGIRLSDRKDNYYSSELIEDSSVVKLWIADGSSDSNSLYALKLTELRLSASAPTGTPLPSPTPSVSPLPDEDDEYNEADDEYINEYIDDGEEIRICSISIDCSTALKYDEINEALLLTLPEDGYILPYTEIEITEGMTVYDVLLTAAEMNGISIDGDSSYISGLNDLREFSCGALSGWMYSVNGIFPDVSVGDYEVSDNDEIAFRYTCDLGDDL